MRLIIWIIALILITSFKTNAEINGAKKYYVSRYKEHHFLGNLHYTLVENKNGNLLFRYLEISQTSGGIWEEFPSEILPFQPGTGNHFQIIKLSKSRIKGYLINGSKYTKKRIILYFHNNSEKYDAILKNMIFWRLQEAYGDTAAKVLRVQSPSFRPLNQNMIRYEWIEKKYNSDSFAIVFKKLFEHDIDSVKTIVKHQESLLDSLNKGLIVPDSAMFDQLFSNYWLEFFQNRLLYVMIMKKPELYFKSANLDRSFIENGICYCDTCFTQDEIDNMYCKLIPLKSINPGSLHAFEHRGGLKCEDK